MPSDFESGANATEPPLNIIEEKVEESRTGRANKQANKTAHNATHTEKKMDHRKWDNLEKTSNTTAHSSHYIPQKHTTVDFQLATMSYNKPLLAFAIFTDCIHYSEKYSNWYKPETIYIALMDGLKKNIKEEKKTKFKGNGKGEKG